MIGKRLNSVKGFEDVSMMVKFLDNKYVEDLLNGKLYMNNFKYFIELEERLKKKGQGDKLEGAFVINTNNHTMLDKSTGTKTSLKGKGQFVYRNEFVNEILLFCLTHFTSNDFLITEVK